jgi:hypothetical protein
VIEMKYLHNVEKLPGKTHYTGYGGGVWKIHKFSHNVWIAEPSARNTPESQYFERKTLREISEHLEELSRLKYPAPLDGISAKELDLLRAAN